MIDPGTLYVSNDNNIFVRGLRNPISKAYDNTAVLKFTLQDAGGSNVSGAVDISMAYVTGSNGHYSGILQGSVSLTAGEEYVAVITDDGGNHRWELEFIAAVRDGSEVDV